MISATGRPLLAVSMAVGIAGGAVAAFPIGGPLLFAGFKAPLLNGGLSAVIGAAAGLAGADDAGRRYLIGVAAAAQSGVFPVRAGLALVLGFPTAAVTAERCATFAINIAAILALTTAVYALVGIRARRGTRGIRPR